MKICKQFLSVLLAVVMLVCAVPVMEVSAVSGDEIVGYARRYLNYPYVWGTAGPNTFDCSGLVKYVFGHFGINLPHGTGYIWDNPTSYGNIIAYGNTSNAMPGDLISWPGHIAIYSGNGNGIEALNENMGVVEIAVSNHSFPNYDASNYRVIRVYGVNSIPDTEKPSISNSAVSNEKDCFLVTCSVADNVGVSWTQFAAWRADRGAETAVWYDGVMTDGGAYCVIKKSDFANYEGFYKCKIYAVDAAGNIESYMIPYDIYIGNLVSVWKITDKNNRKLDSDIRSTPQVCGNVRVWFEKYDWDYNYYLNVYIDETRVLYNQQCDQNGHLYYDLNTAIYAKGQHKIKVELYDTKTMYSDMIWVQIVDHNYISSVSISPTCTTTGVRTYTCTRCNATKAETISKTAHQTVLINVREASYDADGYTGDTYCTVCKQTLSYGSSISKLAKPEEQTNQTNPTQPTTQQQQQSGNCKYCGGTHSGFLGIIIGFFHSVLALFGLRK